MHNVFGAEFLESGEAAIRGGMHATYSDGEYLWYWFKGGYVSRPLP